ITQTVRAWSPSLVGGITCIVDEQQALQPLGPGELAHRAQQLLHAGLGAEVSRCPQHTQAWMLCAQLLLQLPQRRVTACAQKQHRTGRQQPGQQRGQGAAEAPGGPSQHANVSVQLKGNSPRVNNEVNIMKFLVHVHIIKLFHMVQTREITYLIMEYASKGELFYHIRKLDIKANNVLIDYTVKVVSGKKLKDFCSTLAICAPELFGEEPYNGCASDIWNLGVLLFFMVAGHVPFQDSSFVGMRKQILAANFNIQCFNPVPIDIFSVIVELLMINPDRRLTISQILRRSMIRDSQACAPHNSTQSLPGTLSLALLGS
ncbi:hypothetical protein U0070_026301, partial [Myodes glareolus]